MKNTISVEGEAGLVFVCAGFCLTADCICRELDGKTVDGVSIQKPPVHDGEHPCNCYLVTKDMIGV